MTVRLNSISAARLCYGISIAALAMAGCGGGADFGENVPIQQSRLEAAAGSFVPGKSLAFPNDHPFNVTDTQRRSNGVATASSEATPAGTAFCEVDAASGGSGSAEFQIGQVVPYDGKSAAPVAVTFDVVYECVLTSCTPRSSASPLGLKAYVMDSQRRTLAKVMIAEADAESLPDRWSGSVSPSFDVTLEPGHAYHFVVAGRVDVTGDESPGPSASLRVKSLNIQVVPGPQSPQ